MMNHDNREYSMEITYFKLEIEPNILARHRGIDERILKIRMEINGQQYNLRKCLLPDDLTSFYDQVFETAKKLLKNRITGKTCNPSGLEEFG